MQGLHYLHNTCLTSQWTSFLFHFSQPGGGAASTLCVGDPASVSERRDPSLHPQYPRCGQISLLGDSSSSEAQWHVWSLSKIPAKDQVPLCPDDEVSRFEMVKCCCVFSPPCFIMFSHVCLFKDFPAPQDWQTDKNSFLPARLKEKNQSSKVLSLIRVKFIGWSKREGE